MRVELLQYEGCPLAPAALQLVRRCLIALGVPDPVLVRVGDPARRADPGARAGRRANGPRCGVPGWAIPARSAA